MYGLIGKIRCVPGQRDALASILVQATVAMPGCRSYVVPPMRGRSAFERGFRNLLSQNRINSTGEIQEILVSGDLAYCWSALTVRVTPLAGGAATVRTGNALSILRKQSNGSRVVVRDANMLSTTA